MTIKTIGPATVWECTKCGERYVGVIGDKRTRTWQAAHNRHIQSSHGVWYDPRNE